MVLPDPTRVSGPVGQRLTIPTPQAPAGGESTHPSIVYIEGGWNGYEYWMAVTPYAGGDDEYEDPCVLASLDGITWVVPSAAAFPLDDQPGSPGAYNSDVDLRLGPDGNLSLFWRTFDPAAVGAEEKLYFSTSSDGVAWSAKVNFYTSNMATRRLLSPCFLYEAGAWAMWAVDVVPSPNTVVRLQGGAAPTDAWGAPTVLNVGSLPAGKEPWHLGIIRHPDGYVGLLTDCTLNVSGTDGLLYFIASADGLTWTNSGSTVIPQVQHDQHNALYRATLLPDDVGSLTGWRVWYSAWQTTTPSVWGVFRTWLVERTTAPVLQVADVAGIVSGSHSVTVEARILTEYQTGDDPDGEIIEIESGDIAYDATAAVFSTLAAEVPGLDPRDLSPRFPRIPTMSLGPYGNELFVRIGINTGPSVLWVPMGYYRIDTPDQGGASNAPIRLATSDRMQQIIDERLIRPVQFSRFSTVAAVVFALVFDVFPDAVVLWDDDTEQLPIGRDVIVERDRYKALKDIADSYGKVMYFDSEGVLRFETAPDPTEIAWDLHAGAGGVIVKANRSVTRVNVYNGVCATGEGATENPARGVAVDSGPDSPTRWGSRFGKIPTFYSSPLITTDEQARGAAVAKLQRILGTPYSASFDTVPNPALRPRQAIRVGQLNGDRDLHIVDKLRIPLVAGRTMTGSTREQTLNTITTLDET